MKRLLSWFVWTSEPGVTLYALHHVVRAAHYRARARAIRSPAIRGGLDEPIRRRTAGASCRLIVRSVLSVRIHDSDQGKHDTSD